MVHIFEIEGCPLVLDPERTREFYLTQNKITENCSCDDCQFYTESFTQEPFEIFSLLSSMGVDLQKNLKSDPAGAWCIRDDNENVIHCDQLYTVVGHFSDKYKTFANYEKVEGNFKISAQFKESADDTILVVLSIDRV